MEVVKAFVALKPGFEPSPELELSIMNFIRKKLSPLAMPQEIEVKDKLPKAIGTIQKMVEYYEENAALPEANTAEEVGTAAAFLCSPLVLSRVPSGRCS